MQEQALFSCLQFRKNGIGPLLREKLRVENDSFLYVLNALVCSIALSADLLTNVWLGKLISMLT